MPSSLAIGDFSRATHLTVKTLRHYHESGLLEPAQIDTRTGYRRYTTEQIQVAQIIRRFDCGWQVDCGNGQAALELLRDLEAQRGEIAAAGARARAAFLAHYDLAQGVARICDIIAAPAYAPVYAATISS